MDESAMKAAMKASMKASISNVLEQMFFLPVDAFATGSRGEAPFDDPEVMIVSLVFEGNPSGRFALWMHHASATSITADFSGVDMGDLPKHQVTGTVTEMLNMLGGTTLGLYDPAVVFNLGIPRKIDIAKNQIATACGEKTITLVAHTPESSMRYQLTTD